MNKLRLVVLLVLGFTLITACSGSEAAEPTITDEPATTTTAPSGSQISVERVAPPELDPSLTGDDLLVAIEARWMCDVQRYAFSDLSAMNQALEERLTHYGSTRADYDTFKAELDNQIDLREQVLTEYETYCGED